MKKYSYDRTKAAKKGLQELEAMEGAKYFIMPPLEKFDQKWLIYNSSSAECFIWNQAYWSISW